MGKSNLKRKLSGRKQRLQRKLKQLETQLKASKSTTVAPPAAGFSKEHIVRNFVRSSKLRSYEASKHSMTTVAVVRSCKYSMPSAVRQFQYSDIQIEEDCILGRGIFGKCNKAKIAHLDVCAKVFRTGTKYEWSFPVEVFLMLKFCHENLPLIHGIVHTPKIILTSLHTYENNSVTVHSALYEKEIKEVTVDVWKRILFDLLSAVQHLHNNNIIHNDIKNNNILVEKRSTGQIRGILIDFGKGCMINDAKQYNVGDDRKKRQRKQMYPHIAPDLIDGHCKQSPSSDVYSVGRVIATINTKINIPALTSLSTQCNEYNCLKRPTIDDLKTFMFNLFDYK